MLQYIDETSILGISTEYYILVLVIVHFILIVFGPNNYRTILNNMSKINTNILLVIVGIIPVAMAEEYVFRDMLPFMFGNTLYHRVIYSVLFGLVHISNYIYNKHIPTIIHQVITTIFLGYYLSSYNILHYTVFIHIMYNSVILLISYGLAKYIYGNNNSRYNDIHCVDNFGDSTYFSTVSIKKSNSTGNLNETLRYGRPIDRQCYPFERINKTIFIDDLPSSIKHQIIKFDNFLYK